MAGVAEFYPTLLLANPSTRTSTLDTHTISGGRAGTPSNKREEKVSRKFTLGKRSTIKMNSKQMKSQSVSIDPRVTFRRHFRQPCSCKVTHKGPSKSNSCPAQWALKDPEVICLQSSKALGLYSSTHRDRVTATADFSAGWESRRGVDA